jgi:uncharacterized protein (TIGR00255 family)
MTGFGMAEVSQGTFTARVELRSVNHRFLQTKIRVPAEHGELESKVEALLKKGLIRGAVTVSVRIERALGVKDVSVNAAVARRYQEEFRSLGDGADLTKGELAQLPGVVGISAEEGSQKKEAAAILKAVRVALKELVQARGEEGLSLERDLKKNLAVVEKQRVRIEKRMPGVVKTRQVDLRRRVSMLMEDRGPIDGDLAREISILADKLDVSEEVVRLESHVERMSAQLTKGGELGRQLDFLVQEMFREGNTIGSKCNDAKVAHMVVDMKTHIERMREQVQNIE